MARQPLCLSKNNFKASNPKDGCSLATGSQALFLYYWIQEEDTIGIYAMLSIISTWEPIMRHLF